jgi:WD40 repeat protein
MMNILPWPSLFSPDGRRLLTAVSPVEGSAAFCVWDLATGNAACPLLKHRSATAAALSPDGRYVITVSKDETARVWDAGTGREVCPPLKHGAAVTLAAFSPDGHRLLTGCEDGTARVWALDDAAVRPVTPVFKHGPRLSIVSFSPDGRLILTVAWDHTARVWDAATAAPVSPPLDPGAGVEYASFSADGRSVLVASWQFVLLCSLQPDGRSVAHLERLARLLSGQQIAANGEPAPVAAGALAEAFRRRADAP